MKSIIIMVVFSLLFSMRTIAQNPNQGSSGSAKELGYVKGNVIDETGEPLIGASVRVKDTKTGVITDLDGNYSLQGAKVGQTIIVSYVGYNSVEKKVTGNVLNFTMSSMTNGLDEVVVIGYGTARKKELTGSVSTVKAESLNSISSSSVSQMLQGKVAGMNAIQSSAQPGAGISVTIRGAVSPSGNNSPLYVIDGVPLNSNSTADPGINAGTDYKTGVDRDPLNTLNPNDIESIDVLKDAAAAAIYGAAAANGVVIITTKSGKSGKAKVDYRGVYTTQIKKSYPTLLNARQFREQANLWTKEYYLNEHKMGVYGDNPIDWGNYVAPFDNIDGYEHDVNYLDEISRHGWITDHNLSVNGGTEKTKYYFSYNFYDNQGILKNSDLVRNTIRLNLDQKFSNRLTGRVKMTYSNVKANSTSVGDVGKGGNMMNLAIGFAPDIPPFDENGNINRSYNPMLDNPVGYLRIKDHTSTDRIFITPSLEFKILDGLSARAVGGYDMQSSTRKFWWPASANMRTEYKGNVSLGSAKVINYSGEFYFNYDKSFAGGNHRLSVVAGIGYYKDVNDGFRLNAADFFTDAFGYYNVDIASNKEKGGATSWHTERTKLSQFARLNYTLLNRYILSATVRRDGSSYFAENNKWGIFPSISAAWRLKEEAFLSDNIWLSDLKLRVGYGSTGNENILGSNALTLYTSGYNFYFGNQLNTGLLLTQLENPDLKWETDYTVNVGLDFGFLNQRIYGTVEYFHRGVKDLLDYKKQPSNSPVGSIAANVGETESKGFEVTLNSVNITNPNFNWTTNLTVSHFKTNWVKRNPDVSLAEYIGEKDELDAIYGWLTDGIIRSKDEIPSYMPDAAVGNIKYVDYNKDGVLDSKDVVKFGNNTPRWLVGFGNTLTWKGFDLNFYFYGAFGYKKAQGQLPSAFAVGGSRVAPSNTYASVATEVFNSITGNGWMPGIASNPYDGNNPTWLNDFYYMDGSYVKLKNITLGYSLPESVFKSKKILSAARFFVDAQNVFTITKYKGFDPEMAPELPYPQALSLSFGVNLSF